MYLTIQRTYGLWPEFWIFVNSMDKIMGLIIQHHVGYRADLDWILKFLKRVWINVDSLQTCSIAYSTYNILM